MRKGTVLFFCLVLITGFVFGQNDKLLYGMNEETKKEILALAEGFGYFALLNLDNPKADLSGIFSFLEMLPGESSHMYEISENEILNKAFTEGIEKIKLDDDEELLLITNEVFIPSDRNNIRKWMCPVNEEMWGEVAEEFKVIEKDKSKRNLNEECVQTLDFSLSYFPHVIVIEKDQHGIVYEYNFQCTVVTNRREFEISVVKENNEYRWFIK